MTRRDFLKWLLLVPTIDWQKPVRMKLKYDPPYKYIIFGGNAGGGKTETLWRMTEAQRKFFETPTNIEFRLYRYR